MGKVLKSFDGAFAYYEEGVRVPLPVSCSEVKETAEETGERVFSLTAPSLPPDVWSQALWEETAQTSAFGMSVAVGTSGRVVSGGGY